MSVNPILDTGPGETGAPGAAVAFAYAGRLRGDPSEINPPGWLIDWDKAPWNVKVYDGGTRTRLPGAVPAWLPSAAGPASAPGERSLLDVLGPLLFQAAGITRVRWSPGGVILSSPERPAAVQPGRRLGSRRAVPSGGAMYPAELYLVLAAPDASGEGRSRLCHYDPARHELTDLAHPAAAPAFRTALSSPPAQWPPVLVVVTNRFLKNVHKYGNFAYRLGAVDLGVVLSRVLRLGQDAFGVVRTWFDFDDEAVATLLGLDLDEEAPYAVAGLGELPHSTRWPGPGPVARPHPPAVRERAAGARPPEAFGAVHRAAAAVGAPLTAGTRATRDTSPPEPYDGGRAAAAHPLPSPRSWRYTFREAIARRTSNGHLFSGAALAEETLGTILSAGTGALATVINNTAGIPAPEPVLYCAVHAVSGVAAGCYRYDSLAHALVPAHTAGHETARELQAALYARSVNTELAAFTVHVADVLDFRADSRGARAYRVQQMVVGAAIEGVTLAAAGMGAGSHPLLGFDAARVDRLYGLDGTSRGVLAQVCVGGVRTATSIEGSVMS